jgi:exodeoxyribonuclease-1
VSYVFYDIETTGLRQRYDQITSFAAVQTDNDLVITDQFEIKARICPHIIPSLGAIAVTGIGIDQLFDPALPSQYEAVAAIHAKMDAWCPSLFAGFNSVSFDEELLRHAFYQNLKPAYVTSKRGNGRADVLGLCRVTAGQRPDILVPATGADGRKTFRLAELAAANGLAPVGAHSAMVDVMTTLSLCRHIKSRSPEIWSIFARFATKPAVDAFTDGEDAFLYFSARPGPESPLVLMRLGPYARNPARVHCLDLLSDLDAFAALDDAALAAALAARGGPLVPLRLNAAPMMTELFQGTPEQLAGLEEEEIVGRAVRIRSEPTLGPRMLALAQAAEREFGTPEHVEDQLYGFERPGWRDGTRMEEFHGADWTRRAALIREFEDRRLQQLARRIVYFENPTLLPGAEADAMEHGINARHLATGKIPWLTLAGARAELAKLGLESSAVKHLEPRTLTAYRAYLDAIESRLSSKPMVPA